MQLPLRCSATRRGTEYTHVTAKLVHTRQTQTDASRHTPEARAGRDAGPGRQPLKTGPADEVGVALGEEVGLLVGLALGVLVGVLDGVSVGEADGLAVGEGVEVRTHRPVLRQVPSSASFLSACLRRQHSPRRDQGH